MYKQFYVNNLRVCETNFSLLKDDISSFRAYAFLSVTGMRVDVWKNDSNVNPEELGLYLEGDILQLASRSGLTNTRAHWPGGVVPFEIGGAFSEYYSHLRVGENNRECYEVN